MRFALAYPEVATQPFHVRPASLDDVDEVLEILAEAARWTRARGYGNWPERFSRRFVASHAAAGELFLVAIDAAVAATLTLQWSDLRFWGETAPDAGYVHRLAVRRGYAGCGLGHRLLNWADAQAVARGCEFLRLDVVSDNGPLRGYYEQIGFAHQRDVEGEEHLPDGTRWPWCTSLYERACVRRNEQ